MYGAENQINGWKMSAGIGPVEPVFATAFLAIGAVRLVLG